MSVIDEVPTRSTPTVAVTSWPKYSGLEDSDSYFTRGASGKYPSIPCRRARSASAASTYRTIVACG
ncbi:MAG TPA: hypothetical protein VGG75_13070 [Trebonia sp.]